VIRVRLLFLSLPLAGWCVVGLSFPMDLSCMLYYCHKLVYLRIAQHESITIERGKVGPLLDDCGVHPTQESVHGVHPPQVSVPTFDNVIILIYSIVFL
jgi:hypothetical protein